MFELDTEFVEDKVFSSDDEEDQGRQPPSSQPQQLNQQTQNQQQQQQQYRRGPMGPRPEWQQHDRRHTAYDMHRQGHPGHLPMHQQPPRQGPPPPGYFGHMPPGPMPPVGLPNLGLNGPGPQQPRGVTASQYMNKHGNKPTAGPGDAQPAVERRTVEPTDCVLISNLDWWVSDLDVRKMCSTVGAVRNVRFLEDRATGVSRGVCLVEYESREAAGKAVLQLDRRIRHRWSRCARLGITHTQSTRHVPLL